VLDSTVFYTLIAFMQDPITVNNIFAELAKPEQKALRKLALDSSKSLGQIFFEIVNAKAQQINEGQPKPETNDHAKTQ